MLALYSARRGSIHKPNHKSYPINTDICDSPRNTASRLPFTDCHYRFRQTQNRPDIFKIRNFITDNLISQSGYIIQNILTIAQTIPILTPLKRIFASTSHRNIDLIDNTQHSNDASFETINKTKQ